MVQFITLLKAISNYSKGKEGYARELRLRTNYSCSLLNLSRIYFFPFYSDLIILSIYSVCLLFCYCLLILFIYITF